MTASPKRLLQFRVLTALLAMGLCMGVALTVDWICGLALDARWDPHWRPFLYRGLLKTTGTSDKRDGVSSFGTSPVQAPLVVPQSEAVSGSLHEPALDPMDRAGDKVFDPQSAMGKYKEIPYRIPLSPFTMSLNTVRGKPIYHVKYSIDQFARRAAPLPASVTSRKSFLVMLGCSYTFGEGVQDDETMSHRVNLSSSRFQSYNYGVMGASAASMIDRVRAIQPKQEINQNNGWVLYVYMDDHLNRLIMPMSTVAAWGWGAPFYFEDPYGAIRSNGTFEQAHPNISAFYRWFGNTNFVRYFAIDFPWRSTVSHWDYYARVIGQLRRTSTERIGNAQFAVMIFPGMTGRRLIPHLERLGIRYLDYSRWNLRRMTQGRENIPYDGHPSAETYRILGESLARELENLDAKNRITAH